MTIQTSADIINGTYETLGSLMVLLSIRRVLQDRKVAGVSWLPILFFSTWGLWNLIYYPVLGQYFSLAGGSLLATSNAVYLYLLIKFGGLKI